MTLLSQYFAIKTSHQALDDLVKSFISSVKVLTLEAYELLHRKHCSVFAKLTSLFDSVLCELEKAQNIIEQQDKTNQQQDQTIQELKEEPTALAVPNAKPLLLKASNLIKFC